MERAAVRLPLCEDGRPVGVEVGGGRDLDYVWSSYWLRCLLRGGRKAVSELVLWQLPIAGALIQIQYASSGAGFWCQAPRFPLPPTHPTAKPLHRARTCSTGAAE